MTKAEVVTEIANKTGLEKVAVQATVEAFMASLKHSLCNGENVYLRGFGSFVVKKRAEKTDFVCVIAGNCNTILEKSLDNMVVEF